MRRRTLEKGKGQESNGRPQVNYASRGKPTLIRQNRGKKIGAESARLAAAEHCFFHYPTLYTAWNPRRTSQGHWLVSVVLTHPDYGVVGDVGELTLDSKTGKILASTPPARVVAAGKRLLQEKRDVLTAASIQARGRR